MGQEGSTLLDVLLWEWLCVSITAALPPSEAFSPARYYAITKELQPLLEIVSKNEKFLNAGALRRPVTSRFSDSCIFKFEKN